MNQHKKPPQPELKRNQLQLDENQIALLGSTDPERVEIGALLIEGEVYRDQLDRSGKRVEGYERAVYMHWGQNLIRVYGSSWTGAADERVAKIRKQLVVKAKMKT